MIVCDKCGKKDGEHEHMVEVKFCYTGEPKVYHLCGECSVDIVCKIEGVDKRFSAVIFND